MTRHGSKQNCPCKLPIQQQIQQFLPLLRSIARAKDFKDKKKIFLRAPKCISKFLSECAGAILRRDIELPIKQYKKLKPFKQNLLLLSHPKIPKKEKVNSFLLKKGGQFGLIPLIGGILANTVLPLIIEKFRHK
jgi:hypothetical protein